MPSPVRVRFAPSPTGFFHIGSARTALFNWLYARHTGGTFVLRIEDTDATRNSEAFLDVIYDSLTWLGLGWDEGPRVGGGFGPYRQSERGDIYREYLEKLKASGRAYEKEGAVFFKISGEPQVIEDAIRGRVERTEEKDFVIVRSGGSPVFHFVNVVDDIAMQITHVIRGEDHLSNTSKHTELMKAFGAPLPVYAHIPLILKQNGPGKMSKRDQGALIEEYQRRGFLPEALVNFLCLLGWNPGAGDNREKLPLAEIVRLFDLPGVNQSNARFDEKKLAHMNWTYLAELAPDAYVARAREYFARDGRGAGRRRLLPRDHAAQPAEGEVRRGASGLHRVFFHGGFRRRSQGAGESPGQGRSRVPAARADRGPGRRRFFSTDASLEAAVLARATRQGLGLGDYVHVGRLAVSGTNVGPSFFSLLRVLGRRRVLARITRFLAS